MFLRLALCAVAAVSLDARASAAPVTLWTMASQPGDYIGQGRNFSFDPANNIYRVTQNGNRLVVQLTSGDFWSVIFAAPTGQTLTVGTYEEATRINTATKPGLDVSGGGRGSNNSRGRFIVKELTFGPNETVSSAHIVFEQRSEGSTSGIFGEVRINSEGPKPLATRMVAVSPMATSVDHLIDAGVGASSFTAQGLPAGLSLDSATGRITGPRPATHGVALVAVSATRGGESVAGLLALSVAPSPNVTSARLASEPGDFVGAGKSYYYDVSTANFRGFNNNGRARIDLSQADLGGTDGWVFEFGTPDGAPLTVGTYTNAFSNSTTPGNFMSVYGNGRGGNTTGTFRVNEINYGPGYFLNSFSITFEQRAINRTAALRGTVSFNAQSVISAPARVNGERGSAFQFQVVSNNNATQFLANGLPAGLSLDAQTGLIFGTPTQAGFFQVELSAVGPNSIATTIITLAVSPLPPVISGANTASGEASKPFSFQVVIENNPLTVVAPALPLGLSIDQTGLITGSPLIPGFYPVNITAANQTGSAMQRLDLTIAPQNKIMVNVSTRLKVQTGDDILIGGFVIDGPAPKRVLVRATGPSLLGLIDNPLLDPQLELRNATGNLVIANDDWQTQTDGASTQEIVATGFSPSQPAEPAVVRTLNPGAYTVLLRGKNDTVGVGLVEVYDLSPDESQLVNISTRGRVEGGENVMIGGFVIGGTSPTPVVIRVGGPSLANAGIDPLKVLADPTMEIRNAQGVLVAMSDNWREGDESAIAATSLAPADDREPAVYLSLPPGAYTAVVRGKNGSSGVALVEVYRVLP